MPPDPLNSFSVYRYKLTHRPSEQRKLCFRLSKIQLQAALYPNPGFTGGAGFSWVGLRHIGGNESTEGSNSRSPQPPGPPQLPRILGIPCEVMGVEGRRVNVLHFYRVQMPGGFTTPDVSAGATSFGKHWCWIPQLQTKMAQFISLREEGFTYKSNASFSLCLITTIYSVFMHIPKI